MTTEPWDLSYWEFAKEWCCCGDGTDLRCAKCGYAICWICEADDIDGCSPCGWCKAIKEGWGEEERLKSNG